MREFTREISVRNFDVEDIDTVLKYWFSPQNRLYHLSRGANPDSMDILREFGAYRRMARTPVSERQHTAAVVEYRGDAVGHVLLNHLKDPVKRRIHFHMWRKRIPRNSLGDTISLTKAMITESLGYLFEAHDIGEIVGDVSVRNEPVNFVLGKMGIRPSALVEEAYFGRVDVYNRYVFRP